MNLFIILCFDILSTIVKCHLSLNLFVLQKVISFTKFYNTTKMEPGFIDNIFAKITKFTSFELQTG